MDKEITSRPETSRIICLILIFSNQQQQQQQLEDKKGIGTRWIFKNKKDRVIMLD
jgi:hypothetical protein